MRPPQPANRAYLGRQNRLRASTLASQRRTTPIPRVITKGTEKITVPIWWTADRDYEPGETFCLVLPNLHPTLKWKNNTSPVLLVTIENDDPIYIEWARPSEPAKTISVPEGNPSAPDARVEWPSEPTAEGVLTFTQTTPKEIVVEIRARTGSQKCDHPDLPDDEDLTWAGKTDFGHQRWQANNGQPPTRRVVPKGTKTITIPIWWVADRDHEPNETFCLVLPNLDPLLQWKDPERTTLPITLQNDDPNPQQPTNP